MRIDKNRILDIYFDGKPVKEIYIGTDLAYTRVEGEVAYGLSDDKTYAIVVGLGKTEDGEIVISNEYKGRPVKEIGENAFMGTDITSVTIPENITNIGKDAFKNCYNLSTVNFNAVECQDSDPYGSRTFYEAGKNKANGMTLTFGQNVTRIPRYMFRDAVCIKTIDLSNSKKITEIPNIVFSPLYETSNLSNVYFHNDIVKIGDFAFEDTKISTIQLPANLKEVGEDAFYNTNLSEIIIPKNVESIGSGAFNTCNDVTYEGDASKFAALLHYPVSVSSTVQFASGARIRLRGIIDSAKNPVILDNGTLIYPYVSTEVGGVHNNAFKNEQDIKRLIIAANIDSIGEEAFAGCGILNEICIPKTVTTIGTDAFIPVYGDEGIQAVYYEGNYSEWHNLNRPIYKNDGTFTYDTGVPVAAKVYTYQPMYKFVNIK